MTIRFQATGEKHKIDNFYLLDDYRIWMTLCGKKCVYMQNVGKMPVTPTKKNCEVCYGG